jgi:hypothetical protein
MKYDFFTQKICNEYTTRINEGVEDSEKLTLRCKENFGKKGVCIQYGGSKAKYKKFKSCRNKNTRPEDIVMTGEGDNVMCDTVDDHLFPYLQEKMYPWKDEDKDKIFSEEFTEDTPNYIDYVIVYQQNTFCGLMIIEVNECDKKHPNGFYSVKLICVQRVGKKSPSMQLLGLYIYILKQRFPKQRYGFLELAGGYRNVIGYCLYSKLNFKPNPTFNCKEYEVNNLNNLKMKVDMSSIDITMLIDKVRKNDWYDSVLQNENNKICKRCDDKACDEDKQMTLMTLQTKYETDIPDAKKKDKNNNYIPWKQNKHLFFAWHDLYKDLSVNIEETNAAPRKKSPQQKKKSPQQKKKSPQQKKRKSPKQVRRRSKRLMSLK